MILSACGKVGLGKVDESPQRVYFTFVYILFLVVQYGVCSRYGASVGVVVGGDCNNKSSASAAIAPSITQSLAVRL